MEVYYATQLMHRGVHQPMARGPSGRRGGGRGRGRPTPGARWPPTPEGPWRWWGPRTAAAAGEGRERDRGGVGGGDTPHATWLGRGFNSQIRTESKALEPNNYGRAITDDRPSAKHAHLLVQRVWGQGRFLAVGQRAGASPRPNGPLYVGKTQWEAESQAK